MIRKRVYYAIKVILFFAFCKKESFSSKELSARLSISGKVLEQVLLLLKNKGILASKRGPQGGYRLMQDVSDLSLMDIIENIGEDVDVLSAEYCPGRALDLIMKEMEEEVKCGVVSRLRGMKVAKMVKSMKKKVTETGLNYSI